MKYGRDVLLQRYHWRDPPDRQFREKTLVRQMWWGCTENAERRQCAEGREDFNDKDCWMMDGCMNNGGRRGFTNDWSQVRRKMRRGGKKSWRLSYKNRQTAMMNSHERSEEMRGRVLLLYWPSWERHLLDYRAPTWPPLYSVTEYSAEENVARLMALRCNKFRDGSDSFLRWTPASAWYHVW